MPELPEIRDVFGYFVNLVIGRKPVYVGIEYLPVFEIAGSRVHVGTTGWAASAWQMNQHFYFHHPWPRHV